VDFFIFVSCEEKDCYRIVSLGHQNFDSRSYCGLNRRMQGKTGEKNNQGYSPIFKTVHVAENMLRYLSLDDFTLSENCSLLGTDNIRAYFRAKWRLLYIYDETGN